MTATHTWRMGLAPVLLEDGTGRPARRSRVPQVAFLLEGTPWYVHRAVPASAREAGLWTIGAHGRVMPNPNPEPPRGPLSLGSHRRARALVEHLVENGLRDPATVRRPHQLQLVFGAIRAWLARP